MSVAHFLWFSTGSTDSPMILALRLSNSGLSRAMVPSSVVQTGVKSLGCENSTPQESPSHLWKLILPSVVSASKSGAVSPIANAMTNPPNAVLLRGNVAHLDIEVCGLTEGGGDSRGLEATF